MKESTDKLAILKKTFEESIYDVELIWMKGEVVWVAGEDELLGMVTICKFDKPFATYVPKDSVDEFIIEWKNIR